MSGIGRGPRRFPDMSEQWAAGSRPHVARPRPNMSEIGRGPRRFPDMSGRWSAGSRPDGGRPRGLATVVEVHAPPPASVNALLGVAVAGALATGTAGFGVGSPRWALAVALLHGALGLVLVVLAGRKSRISRRGWAAGRPSRWGGAALAVVAVLTVASGVAQSLGLWRLGPVTAMQVHVPSAIATGVGVVWHAVVHPAPLRRALGSRRAVVRGLAVGGAAVAALGVVEAAAWARGGFAGRRRATGSAVLPRLLVTQWLDDRVPPVDEATWRLDVRDGDGRRCLDLAAVREHPARRTVTAVLDCTGGWSAVTTWEGVPLSALVRPGAGDRSVEVVSVTGYRRRLPLRDLEVLVLATHLGGAPLAAGHGAPVRLVAPGRRGYWWVKWVVAVECSPASWLAQPPFPLT
jgi:hypothetical protein